MALDIASKNKIKWIALLSTALLLISIAIYHTGNFAAYRFMRGFICFAFFGTLLIYLGRKVNRYVALFLLLYGSSSIATMWYENGGIATLSMVLNLFSFIVLVFGLFPNIKFRKMNIFFGSLLVLLVLVNAYLLYSFVNMLKDFALSDFHYLFMLLGAMSLVLTGFFALLHNHQVSTSASLSFTAFVFVLIFSEVFRAMGYYDIDIGNLSVYVARATMILALGILTYYELSMKKPSEKLGR